ncbi:MAG: formyltetrahydrofolate deformylase [Pseudomonadota bacterium]
MHTLCLSCKDQVGIVASVSSCLRDNGCNIEESSQFNEPSSNQFYMRVVLSYEDKSAYAKFSNCFEDIAKDYKMKWQLSSCEKKTKTVLMVSKHDHCLHDLLYRVSTGSLPIEVTDVISNHETTKPLVESYNIPFHYQPMVDKEQQEEAVQSIIDNSEADLIVMARYMQILSEDFIEKYHGKVINIHHSFLPGFKGARPYHQAYERGVKIIGATAHFATKDLDEGPIITQKVVPVDHSYTPEKMQSLGRDTESLALAKAISLYAEQRVFIHNNKTIIL